ncbi:hypothetical protein [Fodinicola feengrottensis]|uniref:hypothetical protein n=1 Tax=Fodinicola feengrottensis TaxID=435914 RepID=UPI0024411652|nr:hypothetical protein [Fodinicola feengrottensis]
MSVDLTKFVVTMRVLAEVGDERDAQDQRWGAQNLPDGTGGGFWVNAANDAKLECEAARGRSEMTFRHVLDEEVCEAFAESDPIRLRARS